LINSASIQEVLVRLHAALDKDY